MSHLSVAPTGANKLNIFAERTHEVREAERLLAWRSAKAIIAGEGRLHVHVTCVSARKRADETSPRIEP